ncbi:MAG: hypothetical protein IJW46_03840 [Clostridia bacterium]|nr:hypothetical protein [Clostridia bacterium]
MRKRKRGGESPGGWGERGGGEKWKNSTERGYRKREKWKNSTEWGYRKCEKGGYRKVRMGRIWESLLDKGAWLWYSGGGDSIYVIAYVKKRVLALLGT